MALESEMQKSGSEWDLINPTMLYYRTVPDWIKEEDEKDGGKNVKYLYQIMSSYFDTLHSQIFSIDKLKDNVYPLKQGKAIPFAKKLVESQGLLVSDILLNTELLEKVEKVDSNKVHFEKEIDEIKNLIYTNLYNNMDFILKSKGNEKSIRNALRCFGIDDELVKLNVYTDGGKHYFKDKYRQTSLMKKHVSFNHPDRFSATITQTSSVTNSFSYITGSDDGDKEITSAFTAEASVIFPQRPSPFDEAYYNTPFISSSIFGMYRSIRKDIGDYTWPPAHKENFQVYAVRDRQNSEKAKFVLENYVQNIFITSSYYPDVYTNQHWNFAVRVKPDTYPFRGNVVEATTPGFQI